MLTGYPLSCTLGRSVLGIGSGVARFLMTAEYATYRYLRCVVNAMLLLSQLSFSFYISLSYVYFLFFLNLFYFNRVLQPCLLIRDVNRAAQLALPLLSFFCSVVE